MQHGKLFMLLGITDHNHSRKIYDYIERLEKAALLLNSFVVTTPFSCQLMRLHGDNWTLQSKRPEQIACDEFSNKLAKRATQLDSLYVKGIIPAFKEITIED